MAPIVRQAVLQGRELLSLDGVEYMHLLNRELLPRVEWTTTPVRAVWAYWAPRLSGRARGIAVIRINRALQAPRTQVSDDLLAYLVWHELCHHLLPGRGHDAEFRRIESLWPNFETLDHELDTLHERYDVGWRSHESVS